jgi:HAD superfamily hydrolase (TIGR01509 family)
MQIDIAFPFAAVLWDMDGTLIDSEPIWIEEETKLMRALGVDWSDEDSKHCLGGPADRVDGYMRARAGHVHAPMELSNILTGRMMERLKFETRFMPGAGELLTELHLAQVPLALVTASTSEIMEAVLAGIGAHHFRTAISCDHVANAKPHPEGYLLAAERIGVEIEDCLIIEDSIPGMTAAIEAGAYVIGIPHVVELPKSPRAVHIENLVGHDRNTISKLFEEIIR